MFSLFLVFDLRYSKEALHQHTLLNLIFLTLPSNGFLHNKIIKTF